MPSLTEIHEKLASFDNVISEENEELYKEAAEEEAAGRITARGFMDELQKLAAAAMGEPMPSLPPKADAATGNLGGGTSGRGSVDSSRGRDNAMKAGKLPAYAPRGPRDVDTSRMG
jgi:hypothetical protein